MRIHRLLVLAIVPVLAALAPLTVTASQNVIIAQAAQPTPDQVKTAVKNALMSCNLTMRQKREIKPMVQSFQQQTANADDATKKTAAKALMKDIYGVLTPEQQTQFKASIKQSLSMDIQ